MKETQRTEYRWTLEEDERFSWVKGSFAHEGHAFTVEEMSLEHRGDGESVVYLRGPWENGYDPEPRTGADGQELKHRGGWEFLYAYVSSDAGRIRELPLEVRDVLATAGLRIPLEVDGHGF
jgi:hypothetical protein